MNQYPFPYENSSEITGWTIFIHVLMLVLAAIPFIAIWWQTNRKVGAADFIIGIVALGAGVVFFPVLILRAEETAQPFFVGYFLFFVVACVSFLAVSAYRRYQSKKASAILTTFLSLFGFFLVLCLLTPMVPSAREAARRTACLNDFKQTGLGQQMFHDTYGHFPEAVSINDQGVKTSWRVRVLEFTDDRPVFERYDQNLKWDEGSNRNLAKKEMQIYDCPSIKSVEKDGNGFTFSRHSRILGKGTPFGDNKKLTLKDFPNGTSNCINTIEASGAFIRWSEPNDVILTKDSLGINLPGNRPGHSAGIGSSYHPAGVNVSLIDGSARCISQDIDPEVLRGLATGAKVTKEKLADQ